ncbi:MAG: nuclease-related domain-containing protein [Actinomycetota bacterium]
MAVAARSGAGSLSGLLPRLSRPWSKVLRRDESLADLLAALEPLGYAVLHDVETDGGTADHVVVGPSGVFVIQTRTWRGNVHQATRGRLMCDGKDRSEAVDHAIAVTAAIGRRLDGIGVRWVNAILAVSDARVRHPMTFRRVRVTSGRDAVALILNAPERLTRPEVARAGSMLARRGLHRLRAQPS